MSHASILRIPLGLAKYDLRLDYDTIKVYMFTDPKDSTWIRQIRLKIIL